MSQFSSRLSHFHLDKVELNYTDHGIFYLSVDEDWGPS